VTGTGSFVAKNRKTRPEVKGKKMRIRNLLLAILFGIGMAGPALGSIIPVSPVPGSDFNDLGGGLSPISGWPAATCEMSNLGLKLRGEVINQVFIDTSESEDYYYFYQIANTGVDETWHMIEVLALSPFAEAGESTSIGYLTANEPSAFVSGSDHIIPAGATINTDSGPTVSFNFPEIIQDYLL